MDWEEFKIDLRYPSGWPVIRTIRHTWSWLGRVFSYAILLWDDIDVDHGEILDLLRFKIKRIRDHIYKHRMHENWEKDVAEMNEGIRLIDLITEDKRFDEELMAHYTKWEHKPVLEGDHYIYPSMSDEEKAEWEPLSKRYYAAKEQDWHNLWKYLDEHLQNWWC